MTIGLVLIALNHKLSRRSTALYVDTFALRTLLRKNGSDHGIPKLELALQSKQTLGAGNERTIQRKVDITHF